MIRNSALQTRLARSIVRKAGIRLPEAETTDTASNPTPILSLVGARLVGSSCSPELQVLIDAFHSDPTDANRSALVAYLEAALGMTLEQAFPAAFAQVIDSGNPVTVRAQIGSDAVELTFERTAGVASTGDGYQVTLSGTYHFDIASLAYAASTNELAWTTGMKGDNSGYATDVHDSQRVHLGQGQHAVIGQGFGPAGLVVIGDSLAWRKNPRRVLDIDPIVVTVPNSPSSGNPVRAFIRYVGTSPRHGEFVRFFNDSRGVVLYSQVGPPVYFGVLLRSDAQVADGHPLTDWWFDLGSTIAPGPLDAVELRASGVGSYEKSAQNQSLTAGASAATFDAEFDAFHDYIYTNPAIGRDYSTSFDSDAAGTSMTLTTSPTFRGWACYFWWHPSAGWYWRMPAVQGNPDVGTLGPARGEVYHAPVDMSQGTWTALTFRDEINDAKTQMNLASNFSRQGEFIHRSTQTFPEPHQARYILARGPWVRIAPGVPQEDATARLADAECLTAEAFPHWPGT